MSSELHDIEYMTQYLPGTYEEAVKKRNREDRDKTTTSSLNSLATLGLTGAIALGANGRKETGLRVGAGAASAAVGYHGSRLLGGSPGVNVLAAALMGTAGYVFEPKVLGKITE